MTHTLPNTNDINSMVGDMTFANPTETKEDVIHLAACCYLAHHQRNDFSHTDPVEEILLSDCDKWQGALFSVLCICMNKDKQSPTSTSITYNQRALKESLYSRAEIVSGVTALLTQWYKGYEKPWVHSDSFQKADTKLHSMGF
jgi:hypothetical protein